MRLGRTQAVVGALGLIMALVGIPADAGGRFGKGGEKVKGHVIKVEQQTRTGNSGEFTQLTIRTRNGDQLRLNLGSSASCPGGCVQVGDQVQARLQGAQGPNGVGQAQSMKVRRNGEMFKLQNSGSGNMVRQQGRLGDGSGAGRENRNGGSGGPRDGSNCNDGGPSGDQGGGQRGGQRGSSGGGGSRGGGGSGGGSGRG